MADIFNIAGEINSTSQEGTAVHANQVKDDLQNKKQSQINEEVGEELVLHTNRLNALTGQNYVTVVATQSTTVADIPTLINASGEGEQADTLYRVGFWDGSAYVADKYTEYAWNGTAYVILDVKSSISEVFDISLYKAVGGVLATFADLSAALDGGNNVPAGVRQGGMSIKFVQSSDNKYVQYRYMLDNAATDSNFTNIANWQGNNIYCNFKSKFGELIYNGGNSYSDKVGAIAGHSFVIYLQDIDNCDDNQNVYFAVHVKYSESESENTIISNNQSSFVKKNKYAFALSSGNGDVEYIRIAARVKEGKSLLYQIDDVTYTNETATQTLETAEKSLNNQEKGFGEFCSKVLLSYGRIETDTTISDGYKVIEPISNGYAHSQILHNVLQVIPTTIPCAILKYDNNGNYLGFLSATTEARSFSVENIRLQVPVGNGETLTDIEESITIVSNYEKHKLDVIDTIGTNRVEYFQGGFANDGTLTDTPNRVHTNILKNVKSITPQNGYEFTVLRYDSDGSADATLWGWKQTTFDIPYSNHTIRVCIRKTDESAFNAEDAYGVLQIVRYSQCEILSNESFGFNSRNVMLDYGNISPTTSEVSNARTNRLHSGYIDNCLCVYAESGYEVAVLIINEDGTFDQTPYVWKSEYAFSKPHRVRFNVRKSDNTDIANISDVIPHIFVLTSTSYIPKKISILGDSLSTFGTATVEHPDPQDNYGGIWTYPQNGCRYPQDNLFFDVDHTWFKRLIDNFGFTLGINESWAGTTITDARTDIPPISLQSRIDHLDDNGTPDIIFIFGGTNDINRGPSEQHPTIPEVPLGTFNTEDPTNYTAEEIAALPNHTFADGVRTMLIRVLKTYPTSKVIMILPFITTNPSRNTRLDAFLEVLKEACDYFGVAYVDARRAGINMWNKSSYLPDSLHCNAKGAEMLYEEVASFVGYNDLLLKYL